MRWFPGRFLLLSLLLPFTAYKGGESPFVTFFSHLGDAQTGKTAASVMNFVVLASALSSLNAGLYSTGRILRSMAMNGSAPGSPDSRFGVVLRLKPGSGPNVALTSCARWPG